MPSDPTDHSVASGPGPSEKSAEPAWARLPDEELLGVKLCDLGLRIAGSRLDGPIRQLRSELKARDLLLRPHFWLAEEWFSPDGVPGMGIPFYLAHPRLMKLEERQMFEVEGGTHDWCMQLLRHETGHVMDTAYRLRRRKQWRQTFGSATQPYPDRYVPKPYSKRYVLHLAAWYAQSHPTEDFAETFALWLTPGSRWRRRYKGWPALKKLEYVDELMSELRDTPPPVQSRAQVEPIRNIRRTLREHYQQKRAWYGTDIPDFYDRDLRRLFSDAREHRKQPSAAAFVRRVRKDVRRQVAYWTHEYQYTIDQLLADIIDRCRELNLRLRDSQEQTRTNLTVMLTVQTVRYIEGGRHRIVV